MAADASPGDAGGPYTVRAALVPAAARSEGSRKDDGVGVVKRLARLAPLLLSGLLIGCAIVRPLPKERTMAERLAALPTRDLPLNGPVSIYWDAHQIPFIEAGDDLDAAFALGLVHAHLRLGQMAIYRRIARGRIAEMGGPLATDIDHGLRILDYGRAAPAIVAALPAATRLWLERFVAGINLYQERAQELPFEYRVLGLSREPWTVADVLTFGRLAGTDVTWLVWANLLRLRERPDWPQLWARLVDVGSHADVTPGEGTADGELAALIASLSRSGSNSLAIAGSRSASGGALLANDPHLGIGLPNTWLIAGLKSPSYHVVGLMVPGLPVFGIGRNPAIAWGGTNMRATASDLIDVSATEAEFTRRPERIAVRWWRDREIEVRESRWGPIVSDAPQLADFRLPPLALRWTGHDASDEIGAFLGVAKATDFEEFRRALASFSVPGQNMLYADAAGNIGQVMAVRVPERNGPPPEDMIVSEARAAALWSHLRDANDLPRAFNPPQGFLASANNRPRTDEVAVGAFFSPDDRVLRMAELVGATRTIALDDLKAIQQDVFVRSSLELRNVWLERMQALDVAATASPEQRRFLDEFAAWDGHYRVGSRGAVIFELFRAAFTERFYGARFGETDWAAFANLGKIKTLLVEDIKAAPAKDLAGHLRAALATATDKAAEFTDWGSMHRLRLGHPLRYVPVFGRRFAFADHPIGGSTDTLMKTAHATTLERHTTRYGANARHISDLADMDANYFVVLGGQDGWINSANFIDQVPLWLSGRYVQVPLRLESVRAHFATRTILTPAAAGTAPD